MGAASTLSEAASPVGLGLDDTIFAFASGVGRAAIAVVRISGPLAEPLLRAMLRAKLPEPRRASLRTLHHAFGDEVLDRGLVLWMPGPGTFTGEDQVELQVHGGTAVRAAFANALGQYPGCRPAEPGEFTRRAFLKGRLDLTAVEGLADLIEAETDAQRRQALRQLDGEFGRLASAWRDDLLDGLAACEAELDFSDEGDVPSSLWAAQAPRVRKVRAAIEQELESGRSGERLRDGLTVVIAGPPNAGKSTLLNAIARREVAIVSPHAGTTRDAIEVRCDLGGWPVTFVDTAGLRETGDEVERIGIDRTRQHMSAADLVLYLAPIGEGADDPPKSGVEAVIVQTKLDLRSDLSPRSGLGVSARTGEGLPELLDEVRTRASALMGEDGGALVTRERHRAALRDAAGCLARIDLVPDGAVELVAEDLRLALRALGRLTGAVDVDDVLDRIFSSFCIGK